MFTLYVVSVGVYAGRDVNGEGIYNTSARKQGRRETVVSGGFLPVFAGNLVYGVPPAQDTAGTNARVLPPSCTRRLLLPLNTATLYACLYFVVCV